MANVSELVTDIRITKLNSGTLRGMVSCKVAGIFYLGGMRIIEGKNGLFIGMASYKDKSGEYKDTYYPSSKEVRDELQELILGVYYGME